MPPPPPSSAMGYTKDQLLARLQELNIDFTCYDHPVVMTVEEQAKYVGHLGGALSKNLFLKDKKQRLYVVSALADTKIDLKVLAQRLGVGKGGVRMATEEALLQVLQVPLGCVTPFVLINESASAVSLILDQGFKSKNSCYFHPLTNDVTIGTVQNTLLMVFHYFNCQ
uniref:YbaK/aminoacyl-tRNA synthetase-associated domain-containing protein n=1 Tax=Arundo donax TaxID=35708 RepID=A0A0A9DQA0_ARUDO